jgi:erythritol kinase
MSGPLLLGLDAGTSVVKAAAFEADGGIVAAVARPNRVSLAPGGGAEQDMAATWESARTVLAELVARCGGRELAALAVTGQGDGTWLIDPAGEPVAPAWVWLDSRAGEIVERLRASGAAQVAFAYTGTGLAACHQSSQLLWMQAHRPDIVRRAAHALHCKDWLYFKLAGVRATDPSEACFTFGDWRSREYRSEVLDALGLSALADKLPPIVDGTRQAHPLLPEAAAAIGVQAGVPVVLGFVDVVCQALATGAYGGGEDAGLSIFGTSAIHMRLARDPASVVPSPLMTGYCMCFPVPGHIMQCQTNMSGTLNIDWVAELAVQAASCAGVRAERAQVISRLDALAAEAGPGAALFHPFVSGAGERGPFTDSFARASLIGFDQSLGFAELVRSVFEGLGFAARDCYEAMGTIPGEIRVTGGGARAASMRRILAACLDRPVRAVAQPESGAAGAAMMAAVQLGLFPDMASCAARWVLPLLGEAELPDEALARSYARLFPLYRDGYAALPKLWRRLHEAAERARCPMTKGVAVRHHGRCSNIPEGPHKMTEQEARRSIVDACRQMNALGINQGTSGNISLRHGERMLISPTAVPYEEMQPDQIAAMPVHEEYGAWEGPLPPSTEWRFHLDILRNRPDFGAVVHAHPTFCTTLAIARRGIPACHYMIAAFGGIDVRCADYATYGTKELSNHALRALEGRNACLLANHGMIVCAPNLGRAMWLAVELETIARQYWHSLQIGGPVLLSEEQIAETAAKFEGYGAQERTAA